VAGRARGRLRSHERRRRRGRVRRRRRSDGLSTHRIYGETYDGLAPPHGLSGNALALLCGGDLLSALFVADCLDERTGDTILEALD